MFEDLRKSANESYEEFKEEYKDKNDPYAYTEFEKPRKSAGFLGMTAAQRFVIALLVLFMTCILAGFVLILTQKVVLPFF